MKRLRTFNESMEFYSKKIPTLFIQDLLEDYFTELSDRGFNCRFGVFNEIINGEKQDCIVVTINNTNITKKDYKIIDEDIK